MLQLEYGSVAGAAAPKGSTVKAARPLDEIPIGISQNLQVRDVEADEIWGFVGMKEKAKGNLYKTLPRLVTLTLLWRWSELRN